MSNKMLIDAAHPEETRVVVLRGNRVEEFDFEAADRQQLKGNIYLAKVTRVEPSLQAAFVEYGGNRHGFLAFSEIHPDYYQIPVADRQALLDAESEEDDDASEDQRPSKAADDAEADEASPDDAADNDKQGQDAPDAGGTLGAAPTNDGDGPVSPDDDGKPGPIASETAKENLPAGEAPDTEEAKEETAESGDDAEEKGKPKDIAARVPSPDTVSEEASSSPEDEAEIASKDQPDSDENEESGTQNDPVASATDVKGHSEEELADDADAGEAKAQEPVTEADQTTDKAEETAKPPSADTEELGVQDSEEAKASAETTEISDADDRETDAASEAGGNGGEPENSAAKTVLDDKDDHVEDVGAADALEELPRPRKTKPKHYKIQEVIKRRQVILVQVVKEERGNKGAALTTYLSLAGRYSVLMPNTARGGGISRKITDGSDRKRLKSIASELQVPEGMGVILRTAGASRTRAEIRRDFDYLLRLWENVREKTLKSVAPSLVYEEGNLVKRSIRDLYSREIKEVSVAGEDAYREAKDFMRMLMPSHARNVKPYRESTPIFSRYGVEAQLDMMFSPRVTLKSGGYLIINQTEALVAIDVNSGRATRQHNIEDTALHTNLEAAEEVARQLRLRDLAGLIVIDFIDMEESRNNRAVERKLKECLKHERARIQVGRISHFGLLEMSRQRLRTGVLESSVQPCPHCHATGYVRSVSSLALQILRGLEDHLIKGGSHHLIVRTRPDAALYVLNQKRPHLRDLEDRFALNITIIAEAPDDDSDFVIEKGEAATGERPPATSPQLQVFADEDDNDTEVSADSETTSDEEPSPKRSRRRRRRRRNSGDPQEAAPDTEASQETDASAADAVSDVAESAPDTGDSEDGEPGKRRRRRGRRGGKRRGKNRENEATANAEQEDDSTSPGSDAAEHSGSTPDINGVTKEEASEAPDATTIDVSTASTVSENGERPEQAEDSIGESSNAAPNTEPEELVETGQAAAQTSAEDAVETASEAAQPKRSGWWNRRSFF